MALSPQENTNYSDPKYGVIHRTYFPAGVHNHDDVGAAGTHLESYLALPVKANIVAFGIQSASAQDVTLATDDGFELRTVNGTKLATLVSSADYILGSGEATSVAPETATTIAKNHGMVACVASDVGVAGSVIYFVDWSAQHVA